VWLPPKVDVLSQISILQFSHFNRVPYSMHGPTQCTVDFAGKPPILSTFSNLIKILFKEFINKLDKRHIILKEFK
jgi:hypothetical protein